MKRKLACDQHERIKADPLRWAKMELIGYVRIVRGDGTVAVYEHRNCPCTGTMAMLVETSKPRRVA